MTKQNTKKTDNGTEIHWEYASGFTGRASLIEIYNELKRQVDSKIDFIADARCLKIIVVENTLSNGKNVRELHLTANDALLYTGDPEDGTLYRRVTEWLPTPIGHSVLIRPMAISKLCQRMKPAPGVDWVKKMINMWPTHMAEIATRLLHDSAEKHLIRILDGSVRAILSSSYLMIDNYDMALAAMQQAKAVDAQFIECALSETSMRLKMTCKDVYDVIDEVRVRGDNGWYSGGLGDQKYLSKVGAKSWGELPGGPGTIYPVATIYNSETGHGKFNFRIGGMLGICFNIATIEEVFSKIHLGSSQNAGIFSRDTIKKMNEVIIAQLNDAMVAAFDKEKFSEICNYFRVAAETKIAAPTSAVRNAIKVSECLTDDAEAELVEFFMKDYDGDSVFGLVQAVTRYAQGVEDPDKAGDIENFAGEMLREAASFGNEDQK